ncbi:DUF1295 domain-containing protein [Streptomyces canus]|uniref:DUF1295 domain-containing protein n=1 Tax=Streptomyces canus TaxID=58343 RepID=UPI0036E1C7F9
MPRPWSTSPCYRRRRTCTYARDRAAVSHHYDLSNDFYRLLLDDTMAYSCGYWTKDENAGFGPADAQRAKLELICRKLAPRPGARLLDIGCGWGSLTLHAAQPAVGLGFEAVGDAQLARFKADPANRGRIMDRGLWAWTRHPNYFGDFCVWWGLYLMACDLPAAAAVSVVSPLVMSLLLTRGSGKRLLERHMADRPGYAGYVARTSGFLPRPPRRQGAGSS